MSTDTPFIPPIVPIKGGTVCRFHGGSAPQVKRKAQERLEALVDGAIEDIHGLSKQRQHLPTAFNSARYLVDPVLGAPRGSDEKGSSVPQVVIGIAVGGLTGGSVTDMTIVEAGHDATDADILEE
jgi:hypothetical protein